MVLIKASEVGNRGGWDGTSPHPQTGVQVPNKETAMDWTEHQNVVAASASLMAGTGIPEIFENLRIALGNVSPKDKKASIYVTKGIHQPHTNPHIRIETETFTKLGNGWSNAYVQTYHLNVSAKEQPDITGMANRFSWTGVQYTFGEGGVGECWPVGVARTMKLRNGVAGRRNSVSGPEYAAKVKQLSDEAAAAKAVEDFDALCEAFEKLHKTKPIERTVLNDFGSAWVPKKHIVAKADGKGSIEFRYNPKNKQLTLA